jgi:hypothetical protein
MDRSHTDYYLKRKDTYWLRLGRLLKSSDRILPTYLDAGPAARVLGETYEGFKGLLAQLPYIGGEDNMLTFTFVSSAAALAYMRALESHGLPVGAVGEILHAVYEDILTSLPGIAKWWLRSSEFSRGHRRKLKAYAERSQVRAYPGDWVMTFVEGDGKAYDYGCDYTECAVLKFYRQVGAESYMPYVCVIDMTMSRALRTGLQRTTTLYYGADRCDFRYKKGRLGSPGLPIENLPEYRNRKI